ncbi:hypothetical protein JCM8547_006893 [Rhodosporidiobolus lusitaniae]
MTVDYSAAFDPNLVLQSPDFKILEKGVVPQRDTSKNLAAAYAPGANLHLIEKPVPKAREGEVVLHVRASGICGSDCHFWKVHPVSFSSFPSSSLGRPPPAGGGGGWGRRRRLE